MSSEIMSTEVLRRCLAPCGQCTGKYQSAALNKRFVCNCLCHRFASAKEMENWLGSPLNQKLYRVSFVDHNKNRILVEGKELT
jgi:hypothetical protein